MSDWLAGKRALVVGAGSGIGRGVVDAFEAEGAVVAALEIDPDKCADLRASGTLGAVVTGDATTAAANREAVAAAVAEFGGLDILVNCVGVFDYYRRLADIPVDRLDAAFDEMFRINVKSQLHSVKAAQSVLADGGGSIVLTESTSAYYPGRGGTLYVGSKFAVRGLVTTLGYELAPDIRVNGVAPGGTLGTDLRGLASLDMSEQRLDGPQRAAQIASRNPLGVALDGTDHAWSYVFLGSDRARGISGTVIHTDGGMSIKSQ